MRYSDYQSLLLDRLRRRGFSIEEIRKLPCLAMLDYEKRHNIISCFHESLCEPFKAVCACDDLLHLRGTAGGETPTTLLLEWSNTCARYVERAAPQQPRPQALSKEAENESEPEENGNSSCVICWDKARNQMPYICQHIVMCEECVTRVVDPIKLTGCPICGNMEERRAGPNLTASHLQIEVDRAAAVAEALSRAAAIEAERIVDAVDAAEAIHAAALVEATQRAERSCCLTHQAALEDAVTQAFALVESVVETAVAEAVAEAIAKERAEARERADATEYGGICVVCRDELVNQMPFKCPHILLCHGKWCLGDSDPDCALRVVESRRGCPWCKVTDVHPAAKWRVYLP
ncbi:hypothetical protein CcaverHIS641_0302040 [Cutaneotrichosporon cavernicola]|nr:hypothetical protein CcaverHIS641_0302040 [Cutaneotrichosporon cavernicola]